MGDEQLSGRVTPGVGTLLMFAGGAACAVLWFVIGMMLVADEGSRLAGFLGLAAAVVLAPLCIWGIVKAHRLGRAAVTPTGASLNLKMEAGVESMALTRSPLAIGSADSSDLILLDEDIAPVHARVVWDGGRHVLEAVGGAPVQVNGRPCESAPLVRGDAIDIGGFALEFVTGSATPTPARAAGPRLVLLADDEESVFPLGPGELSIGRAPENDVVLLEHGVAAVHARVRLAGDGAVIESVGDSAIAVGRAATRRSQLADGDRVRIDGFTFDFRA